MFRDPEFDDADLRAEAMDERRRRARMNHWCSECHGHPGGPCSFGEPEDEDEPDNELETS